MIARTLLAVALLCAAPAHALQIVTFDTAGAHSFTTATAGLYRISVGGGAGGTGGRGGHGAPSGRGGNGGSVLERPGDSGSAGSNGNAGSEGLVGVLGTLVIGNFDFGADQTLSIFVGAEGRGGPAGLTDFGGRAGGAGGSG